MEKVMKVSSPIGDLPFTPKKIRFKAASIQIEGVMGAWPALVEVTWKDFPAILRMLIWPLAVLIIVGTTAVVVVSAITNQ